MALYPMFLVLFSVPPHWAGAENSTEMPIFFSIICSMMPDLLCATSFHLLVFTVLQLSGSMLIFKLLAAKQHFQTCYASTLHPHCSLPITICSIISTHGILPSNVVQLSTEGYLHNQMQGSSLFCSVRLLIQTLSYLENNI